MQRGEGLESQVSFRGKSPVPNGHVLHFYSSERELLDTLSGYIGEGLNGGESTIVIATPEHLRALRYRLENTDADLIRAMFEDRYITLDASVALTGFMVEGLPDEQLFTDMARNLLRRASVFNRRVRAFGEMESLLWTSGNHKAVVRLEHLWENFCRNHEMAVLCGYPKAAFPGVMATGTRAAEAEIRAAPTPSI